MTDVDLEALSQEAIALRHAGDLEASERTHRSVVSAAPRNPYFKYRLAEVLLDRSPENEEALELLLLCARLDPRFPLFRERAVRQIFKQLPPQKALSEYIALDHDTLAETDPAERMASHHLAAVLLIEIGEWRQCWEALRLAFGERALSFTVDDQLSGRESLLLKYSKSGYDIFMPAEFWRARFLLERMFALFPAFDSVDSTGQFRMCIGDRPDGEERQLCFSSCTSSHIPVPDAIFFQERGYARIRQLFATPPAWSKREPKAYWRGSLTGAAPDLSGIMKLPRVETCLIGRFLPELDAKITDMTQFESFGAPLKDTFLGLDIWGERQPPSANLLFRYLIDVDGNSNAWQSLYLKLLAGGCVIKLRSRWRQWYYERLIHNENVVFVDHPMDFPAAVRRLEAKPNLAEAIARRGREFALSMTMETEVKRFAQTAHKIMAAS